MKSKARASAYHAEWERRALLELYSEYASILREHKISLQPAALELYDSESHWGQWDSETRTIRLSRKLLKNYPWFQVLGVLKHEMAHQLVEELEGQKFTNEKMHGESFKKACKRLGVPYEFSKASLNLQINSLDWRESKADEATERMLEKVRKLLALASSSNEHEALAAMARVRELYARYNLEQVQSQERSEFYHLTITRKSKRLETYEKKIIGILVGHFFVQVIAGQTYDAAIGDRYRSIEIIGSRESVLMAEYVYHFLLQQSEMLVKNAGPLSRVSKKSYRLGVLTGFAQKLSMQEETQNSQSTLGRALMVLNSDKKRDRYISEVYPRLRTLTSARQRIDRSAYSQGQVEGRKINLNKPITSSNGFMGKLLGSK